MGNNSFLKRDLLQVHTCRHRWGVDWRMVNEHAYAAHRSRWQG